MTTNLALLADGLNKYIVRPLNAFGLGGFVFDVESETNVMLSTEITDHFLEDNSTVQDHIAIKPKKVTLKNYVGELVFREDDDTETVIQQVTQKLTILDSFLPTLSAAATQINATIQNDEASGASLKNVTLDSVNKMTDYWAFAQNISPPVNKQEQAYLYFKALMEGKFLVSIQTPFEFMSNMAIESIMAEQGEGSNAIGSFTITLKQIRTASLLNAVEGEERFRESEFPDDQKKQGRNFLQNSDLINLGNISGLDAANDPTLQHKLARKLQRQRLIDAGVIDDLGVVPLTTAAEIEALLQ